MAAGEEMLESLLNRLLNLDGDIRDNIGYENTIIFVNSKTNVATVSKTKSDIKRFREWLQRDGVDCDIETVEQKELDEYLPRFVLSVRNTKTNKEFGPPKMQVILNYVV